MKSRFIKWCVGSVLYFVLYSNITIAQFNYIQNPSFEVLDVCPYIYNQVKLAIPWDTLKNGGGIMPEVFNQCATVNWLSVPKNATSYQWPRSGVSEVNAGFYSSFFVQVPNADYLQSPLKDTLQPGSSYCFTMHVCLTERSTHAIDEIGAFFDNGSISGCYTCMIVAPAQVQSPNGFFISDTLNWVRIQASFVAAPNQNYVTIGNFKPFLQIDTMHVASQWNLTKFSEYLIDDISLFEIGTNIHIDEDTAIANGDTITLGYSILGFPVEWYTMQGTMLANSSLLTVHPTSPAKYIVRMDLCGQVSYDTVTVNVWPLGLPSSHYSSAITLYPNPAHNKLLVSSDGLLLEIEVYDVYGRIMNPPRQSSNQQIELDISNLASGIYFVKVMDKQGRIRSGKFVKSND
jgi:hypothetical protein